MFYLCKGVTRERYHLDSNAGALKQENGLIFVCHFEQGKKFW